MEQDSDAEDTLEQDFENLCLDLNMDVKSKETAWSNVLKIQENYTLEVGHKFIRRQTSPADSKCC